MALCTTCKKREAIAENGTEKICQECAVLFLSTMKNAVPLVKDDERIIKFPDGPKKETDVVDHEAVPVVARPSTCHVIVEYDDGSMRQLRLCDDEPDKIYRKIMENRKTGNRTLQFRLVELVPCDKAEAMNNIIVDLAQLAVLQTDSEDVKKLVDRAYEFVEQCDK